MDAIHVNSTAPFFARGLSKDFQIERFSLYGTVISALEWQKLNGRIFMCTDSTGARYFRSSGLSGVWDGILEIIPDDLEGINPSMFWAAGKLLALRDIPGSAALIDEDFIVWGRLSLSETAVTVAHREYIKDDIYPNPLSFGVQGFSLLERLDMSVLPCNTAFLYIPDKSFRMFYASQSIAFMKAASVRPCDDRLCHMVFAEQRLLAMLCSLTDTPVDTLMNVDKLFIAQDSFTHLWGAKQAMRDNDSLREGFVNKCRKRIMNDFPSYSYLIEAIDGCTADRF